MKNGIAWTFAYDQLKQLPGRWKAYPYKAGYGGLYYIVRSMALVLRNGGQQLLSGFYFPYPYESVTIHMEDRE